MTFCLTCTVCKQKREKGSVTHWSLPYHSPNNPLCTWCITYLCISVTECVQNNKGRQIYFSSWIPGLIPSWPGSSIHGSCNTWRRLFTSQYTRKQRSRLEAGRDTVSKNPSPVICFSSKALHPSFQRLTTWCHHLWTKHSSPEPTGDITLNHITYSESSRGTCGIPSSFQPTWIYFPKWNILTGTTGSLVWTWHSKQ